MEILPSLAGSDDIPCAGELVGEGQRIWIGVSRAIGTKCERCWNYSPKVGSFVDHPTLCERCYDVIEGPLPVGAMAEVS